MQWLQQTSDLFAYTFDEAWFDIGTPQSYLDVVGWYLDSENFVHESATLMNTEVDANIHITTDTVAEDSVFEESVVFPGAVIRSVELKNSIVGEGTHIESLSLSNALIGAHSWLTNGQ